MKTRKTIHLEANRYAAVSTLLFLSVLGLSTLGADSLFSVDFEKTAGYVKQLNGLCNTAGISRLGDPELDELEAFKELDIPLTHFHDDALVNPGYALVDVSRIFPLFRADENDPLNYDFAPTDLYVKRTLETGSEIQFRLGESIEHCGRPFRARPPADMEKWARICLNIIRHYNEGWANGFHYGIRFWNIWEEPNGPKTFAAVHPFEDYCRLYKVVAPAIKREFPNVMVGGPTTGGGKWAVDFVKFCRGQDLPLDFFCWTIYKSNPEELGDMIREFRKLLDDNGYTQTKLHIVEWHLAPKNWRVLRGVGGEELWLKERKRLTGPDAAAYAAATLSYLQDFPIDNMCYYNAIGNIWGLMAGNIYKKLAPWYAFKAFAILSAKGKASRVVLHSQPSSGTYLLASRQDNCGCLLVSKLFDESHFSFEVAGKAVPSKVRVIDATCRLDECSPIAKNWIWDGKNRRIAVNPSADSHSSVWLFEFDLSGTTVVPKERCVQEKPVRTEVNGN